jgi:N-acetylglutamate synthase-like GNAT family acetyltransferase
MYAEDLPNDSSLKSFWRVYIDGALASDLASAQTIQDVYFETSKSSKPGHFWVVIDNNQNGKIVGHVGVEALDEETCELRRMSVATDARKGGLGKKLVTIWFKSSILTL